MDIAWLRDNWALVIAAVLMGTLVSVALFARVASGSRAQLRRARRVLAAKRRVMRRAGTTLEKAEQALGRLQQRAEKIKPRRIDEARAAVADARALAGIAHDQLLIAENQLRRIIVEEFPPARQAQLRARYQVGDAPGKKPFTF